MENNTQNFEEKNDLFDDNDPKENVLTENTQIEIPPVPEPYVYMKPKSNNLPGWVTFYMITTVLGILLTIFLNFQSFNINDYDVGAGPLFTIIGVLLEIVFISGIVGFGIYTLIALQNRKPNAPLIAIIYSSLLIYSHVIQILGAAIAGGYDTEIVFVDFAQSIRSIIIATLWISYFTVSKKIEEFFPKKKRRLGDREITFAVATLVAPVLSFIIALFATIILG